MPLRLLEVFIPGPGEHKVTDLIDDEKALSFWQDRASKNGSLLKMVLSVEQTEKVIDLLEQKYGGRDGFRVVLLPIEATIPRIEEKKTEEAETNGGGKQEEAGNEPLRISREELYSDIVDSTKSTGTFAAMALLSAIVAAVGLMQDNLAILIAVVLFSRQN
jgi:hypothetical protein